MENENKKYQIDWSEIVKEGSTNGRPWKITSMTLKDEQGNITEKVSTFNPVMTGEFITGKIVKNEKGYLNFMNELKAPSFAQNKTKQMEKVMERKEESIKTFQTNKEESIKISSTMRDAVLLAIAEGSPTSETIQKWREWLWLNWDKVDQYPPF